MSKKIILDYFTSKLGFTPTNKIVDKNEIYFFANSRRFSLNRAVCEEELSILLGEPFSFEKTVKDSFYYNIDGIDVHLSLMNESQRRLVMKNCVKNRHIKSKLYDTNHTAKQWIEIINLYEESLKSDKRFVYTIQSHLLAKCNDDMMYIAIAQQQALVINEKIVKL